MYLLIGADIVPTETNIPDFKIGNVLRLVGEELLNILNEADYRIFNLEVPLTDRAAPIKKSGPNLIAPVDTVAGIRALGVNLVTLANNHIMDQGEQGFYSTIETLKKAEIACVGAGKNLWQAAKPYIFELGHKKIGVYACAEHEFSIATERTCGANPFDPLESPDCVAKLKTQCDYLIVLYHGGREHYRYPSPGLQRVCRKLIDKGAGLVICQHSHCIGCKEEYQGGTIVYGQGNFLFDHSEDECWRTSLLIRLDEDFSVSYIPLVKTGASVRMADSQKAKKILSDFERRSEEIKQPDAVRSKFAQLAAREIGKYLMDLRGMRRNGIVFRIFNKLSGHRLPRLFSKNILERELLAMQNYINCETHREMTLAGLNTLLGK